ncbi:restriction endonuclease subunit S [Serratia marcescens]|uniref:restriction endonuclease subunit S n=1 Tax=Serratia marcescens TaxID=615 RepID=UPI003AFB7949
MAKYKAYPEYKDSGVEWLGEIPGHWNICRIKETAIVKNGFPFSSSQFHPENGVPLVRIRDINSKRPEVFFDGYVPSESKIDTGDILIGMDGDFNVSWWEGGEAALNQRVACIRASSYALAKFIFYMIPFNMKMVNDLTYFTTVKHLSSFDILKTVFSLPSDDELISVVGFLDHETAKIDKLIEKQQQLIELLKEKRQAVISHAVTKGLNPDVPMKDSGIEWLGEVPEHWIVRRLKHTSTLQSGMPKGKDLTGKNSISVPMLRVANVQDGYLDLTEVNNINIEPSQLERYLLRDGDVLMNEGGDNDKLGRGAVWNAPIDNCIHQNHVFAIRPFSIESEWLDMLTRADYAKFHFYRVAKQSTNLASISSTNVKETPLLIPPRKERDEILKFINFQLNKIKATEEFSTKQVILLQERRTALISAAVTGKIDVRDWVAPDMQDAEEPQETTA